MSKNIFKFVMPFFFLLLIAFSQNSYAQLSGSYTIPGSPFATVKSAFDSLNLVGVGSGGVTFNITAGYTETVTDSVFILKATGTSADPIIFQKSGAGANPLITRTDAGTKTPTALGAQGDAVIIIQGSDYVTFDGIDVAATFSSTSTTGIEYGYYLRKVSGTDGCKYVTIKNAVIDMTKGTSAFVAGIYSSNNTSGSSLTSATGITITSTGGRNEFVTITGNTIQDVFAGIVLRGFNHTVAPNDFQDYNFVVGASGQGNIIQNYAGGNVATTYGIYLINHTNPTVSYNTINNTGGGGVNATGQIYGIFMSATSASVNRGGDVVMNNNNITIGTSATGSVNSINIAPISTSITVNNNTFSFGTFASTTGSQIINIAQNAPLVTITGNSNSGTITKSGVGQLTCISYSGSPVNGVVTIANNNFSNISLSGASIFIGIASSGSSTATLQTYNNTIANITTGSTGLNYGFNLGTALTQIAYNNSVSNINVSAAGSLYGLAFSGTNATVYNNNINGLTSVGTILVGINNQATGTTSCYKNQVYNLISTYSGASTMNVSGIQITGGTNNNVYNNFISDLKVPNATVITNALFGINVSASSATAKIGIYYNTIYLNSTGASLYRSFGIFSNTGSTSDLRNNIVVNTSTGIPIAYGRSTNALGTYSSLSDNNDFFATNIFFEGTGSTLYPTLAGYKTFVYPRDQATFSENPPFINTTTTPYDLRINTGTQTQTERGGRPVTTPVAITDDYYATTRDASFPDVGAYEFTGTVQDLTAPIIAYTPFDNTSSLSDRTLIVNVSDQAGIPTTAPGWPTLYWKKGVLGLYNAVAPSSVTGNNYTFNFGSGVVPTDTVFYYVVARDTVPTTPNLRAFPTLGAGNYTFDPPAAGTPPTSPYSYRVTSSSLTGDYTVGAGTFNRITGRNITFEKSGDKWLPMENGQRYYGDLYVKKIEHPELNYPDGTDGVYSTITAAIADLNLRGVSGPVNFLLDDASYTKALGETFPIIVNVTNEFKPTITNTVTIKPNAGVTSSIHGASPNSFIFKILSNYVNINGSNSGGTDRSLTIKNDTTYFPMVVSFVSTGTTPITGGSLRNCIVTNGSNAMTSYTPAVLLSNTNIDPANFTFTPGYFTNLNIQNNRIQKSDIGIYCYGVALAGNGNGVSINGNSLSDTTTNSIGNLGIQILGVDGASITNNNIGNIITPVSGGSLPTGIAIQSQTINTTVSNNTIGPINITAASSGPVGIAINTGNANSNLIISNNTISGLRINQAVTINGITVGGQSGGILINKNKISDIKNTYVNSTAAYGAYAINLGSSLTAANITLANNFIWDIAAYGRASTDFHNGYGLYITSGGGYNIYHNTISLTTEQTLATGFPACINITSGVTTAGSLDIRNNIFATFQTVGTDRYAIICKAANTVFAYIDNNDYYTTGPNLGYLVSNRADLTAWKTATGKDVNSISANPRLVSANDLHADPNFDIVDGKGFYLATVPQDIDGDTRNNPPDIGGDEYTFTPPVDPTAVTATAVSDAQINVAFTPNVNSNNVVIVFNLDGVFTSPSGTPVVGQPLAGGTVLDVTLTSPYAHTGLNPVTTYYYKLFSYNGTYYSSGVTVSDTTLSVLDPSAVTATPVNDTQIDVAFTPNANSNNVVIVWNLTGTFTTPSGTPPLVDSSFAGGTVLYNGTVSPVNHTGRTASTTYYYKLFSYNGTYYSAGVAVNATTFAAPITTYPFAETFEDASPTRASWIQVQEVGNGLWSYATGSTGGVITTAYEGLLNARFVSESPSGGGTPVTKLVSPVLNLTSLTSPRVRFYYAQEEWFGDQNELKVYYRISSSDPWVQLAYFINNVDTWTEAALTLPNKSATYQIAFEGINNWGHANVVDLVTVEEAPANDIGVVALSMNYGTLIENVVSSGISREWAEKQSGGKDSKPKNVSISILTPEFANHGPEAVVNLLAIVENFGGAVENSYQVGWVVDGTSQTNASNTQPLEVGDTDTLTLTWSTATAGFHTARAWSILATDINPSNDSSGVTTFYVSPDNAIFTERFESTFPPTGWLTVNRDGGGTSGPWFAGNPSVFPAFEGNGYAGDNYQSANGLYIDDYLITPNTGGLVENTNLDSLIFWMRAPHGSIYPDSVEIRVSTTGIDTSNFTTLLDYIECDTSGNWKRYAYALPSAANRYIAFRYLMYDGGLSGNSSNYIGLDLVEIHRHSAPTTFPLSVTITNGWNMVSIPGLHPTNQNVSTWWPGLTGTVWGFNGVQYVGKTIATPGEGYWMKHVGATVYNYPAIQIVAHTPLNASSGWNMIGGYENSVATIGLVTSPPNQITGTIWGFNGVQYVAANTLVPGYSYWVKLLPGCPCTITIPEALAKGTEAVEYFSEGWMPKAEWGRIILTDAAGLSYTLYAVKGHSPNGGASVDLDQYEMPPMPPAGMFDIRFSSGRIAEDINSAIQTIDMSGIEYPLTVRVEGMDIRLQDVTGKQINLNLKSGEDIVINDATINKLMVSGELIPDKYALEQNYPNPFNPSTVIEFSLPENVGNVKLSIYNALGEKVAELVNTALVAGKYSYQWNASNVATGMYIYELRTDKFVSIKKMMLLK